MNIFKYIHRKFFGARAPEVIPAQTPTNPGSKVYESDPDRYKTVWKDTVTPVRPSSIRDIQPPPMRTYNHTKAAFEPKKTEVKTPAAKRITAYTRNGRPVYVSEPLEIDTDAVADLAVAAITAVSRAQSYSSTSDHDDSRRSIYTPLPVTESYTSSKSSSSNDSSSSSSSSSYDSSSSSYDSSSSSSSYDSGSSSSSFDSGSSSSW